jgi:putative transcriptional regulator
LVERHSKLKGARVEKGLTQEDMAEKIGISTYSYLMKENGKRDFTLTEMKKICEILNKELSEIF